MEIAPFYSNMRRIVTDYSRKKGKQEADLRANPGKSGIRRGELEYI